jgi:hypothetical protein
MLAPEFTASMISPTISSLALLARSIPSFEVISMKLSDFKMPGLDYHILLGPSPFLPY